MPAKKDLITPNGRIAPTQSAPGATPLTLAMHQHRMAWIELERANEEFNFAEEIKGRGDAEMKAFKQAQRAQGIACDNLFDSQWRLLTAMPETWDELEKLFGHVSHSTEFFGEAFPNAWGNIPEFALNEVDGLRKVKDHLNSDSWDCAFRIYARAAILRLRYNGASPALSNNDREYYERKLIAEAA